MSLLRSLSSRCMSVLLLVAASAPPRCAIECSSPLTPIYFGPQDTYQRWRLRRRAACVTSATAASRRPGGRQRELATTGAVATAHNLPPWISGPADDGGPQPRDVPHAPQRGCRFRRGSTMPYKISAELPESVREHLP